MRNIVSILFVIFGITNLYSQYYPNISRKRQSAQQELETLEKLNRLIENDKNTEQKAKQIVLSYNYDLKDKIRESRDKLTEEEYSYLIRYQTNLWNSLSSYLQYYKSYQEFYEKNYQSLEKYKDMVTDKLYELMYN